jgi:hypothetical protein
MTLKCYVFLSFFFGLFLHTPVLHAEPHLTDVNEEFSEFRKQLEDLSNTVHLQSKYIGILQRTVEQQGQLLRRMGLQDENIYKSYKGSDGESTMETAFPKSNQDHRGTSESAAITNYSKPKPGGNTIGILRKGESFANIFDEV